MNNKQASMWNTKILKGYKKAEQRKYTEYEIPDYIDGNLQGLAEEDETLANIEETIKVDISAHYGVPMDEISVSYNDIPGTEINLDVYIGDDIWSGNVEAEDDSWYLSHVYLDELKVSEIFKPNVKTASMICSDFERQFFSKIASNGKENNVWFIYEDPSSGKKYIAKKNKKQTKESGKY
jgi:hypothetical protein